VVIDSRNDRGAIANTNLAQDCDDVSSSTASGDGAALRIRGRDAAGGDVLIRLDYADVLSGDSAENGDQDVGADTQDRSG